MNINEAYEQLNNWLEKSQGNFIDIGSTQKHTFSRIESFSEEKLQLFEEKSNIPLPIEYREFLIEIGSVNIFSGENSAGIKILSPYNIYDFSKEVFDNFGDNLYPELLLTTSIPKTGYFGGFWMKDNTINNYGIFYPEVPPELWIEECEFTSFNNWFIQLIESKSTII